MPLPALAALIGLYENQLMSRRRSWLHRSWRQLQRKSGMFAFGAVLASGGNNMAPDCRNCSRPLSPSDYESPVPKDAEWSCMPRGTRSVACHFWAPTGHKGYACIKAIVRCEGATNTVEVCSGTLWKAEHKRKEGAFDASVEAISECQIEYRGPGQHPDRQPEALALETSLQADCDQRITTWRREPNDLKRARAYEHLPKACKLRLEVR